MKKCGKRVSAFAALFFLACCLYGQNWTAARDFTFSREGNGLTITEYTGSAAVVNIPPSIDGIPVTAIGQRAFFYCRLTSITIPAGVTAIGDLAFAGCSSLTSIIIPNSVTAIGDAAFRDCSSLTSIIIPAGVTAIGDYAFYGCSSLSGITKPAGVTAIGDGAFEGCSSLSAADREAIRGRFGDGVF
jgi:hypothetical protein